MVVAIVVVGLIALVALAIATGVSLGRNGDRMDEYHYRSQIDEALHQLDERLKEVEPPDPPEPGD
jgi:hypothetical protein